MKIGKVRWWGALVAALILLWFSYEMFDGTIFDYYQSLREMSQPGAGQGEIPGPPHDR